MVAVADLVYKYKITHITVKTQKPVTKILILNNFCILRWTKLTLLYLNLRDSSSFAISQCVSRNAVAAIIVCVAHFRLSEVFYIQRPWDHFSRLIFPLKCQEVIYSLGSLNSFLCFKEVSLVIELGTSIFLIIPGVKESGGSEVSEESKGSK